MSLYKPGRFMRGLVVIAQGIFCGFLFPAYIISPRFCHSFVGYLEEQAVVTYTHVLDEIDAGSYPEFEKTASDLAIRYWKLPVGSQWRDVFAAIRAGVCVSMICPCSLICFDVQFALALCLHFEFERIGVVNR